MKKSERPRIKIPITPTEIMLEILTIPAMVLNFVMVIACWSSLPDRIVSHFGMNGRPDGYAGKEVLVLIVALNLILYLFFTVLARFPHNFNYPWEITEENAPEQYLLVRKLFAVLKLEYTSLLAYCLWTCIQVSLQVEETLNATDLVLMIGLIIATFGIYFFSGYKSR